MYGVTLVLLAVASPIPGSAEEVPADCAATTDMTARLDCLRQRLWLLTPPSRPGIRSGTSGGGAPLTDLGTRRKSDGEAASRGGAPRRLASVGHD